MTDSNKQTSSSQDFITTVKGLIVLALVLKGGLAYKIALSKLTPGTPNFFDQGMLTQGKGSVQFASLINQLVLLKS